MGEVVRKVKHSSVRIENQLLALNRGKECFSLARTFRTAWEGDRESAAIPFKHLGAGHLQNVRGK